jgi:hypothetical protein
MAAPDPKTKTTTAQDNSADTSTGENVLEAPNLSASAFVKKDRLVEKDELDKVDDMEADEVVESKPETEELLDDSLTADATIKPEPEFPDLPEVSEELKAAPEEKAVVTEAEKPDLSAELAEQEEILRLTELEKKEIEAGMEDAPSDTLAADVSTTPTTKSKGLQEIESVLEDGMDKYFQNMPPAKQEEFKKVGEETASTVLQLLKAVKVRVVDVLNAIRRWLGLIPGVNKFFIEQESKLKTDNLLRLKKEGKLDNLDQ